MGQIPLSSIHTTMEITYTTTVVIDSKQYTVHGTLEAQVIDDGIGSYEYWGSKGVDRNYCYELEDYEIDGVEDEDGKEIADNELIKRIAEVYQDKAVAYLYDLPVEDTEE
jgi:hypothetical protein